AGVDEKSAGDGEIEGPFLFHKGDYYYLFVSTGLCCRGKNSTYRVAVGRSKDITGPYLDKAGRDMAKGGGTPLLTENKNWAGWGGQGVYTLDGKEYVVMHAYEAADNDFHRLKILQLNWDSSDWPSVDNKAIDTYRSVQVK
ncbi:MAG: family 43 glycosylhydrolase, partial [Rhizomicrobium sp.]